MSVWLEAARKARCQTDKTDRTDRTADTPSIQADPTLRPDASAEVLSVLSVCQFEVDSPAAPASTPRQDPTPRLFCGICKKWVNRDADCSQSGCQLPATVRAAFEDYDATNDPHDPRAWT